ncbi:MAG: CrcB family protein [Ktedonobacterales bacterium]
MRKFALVFAGGFCGALVRYLLAAPLLALASRVWPAAPQGFPFDILFINATGALALGLLYGLFERGAAISAQARLALGTGFLGAYTTFSTYIYGADTLLTRGVVLAGLFYLFGSLALGVACARLGYVGAGAILARRRLLRRGRVYLRRFRRTAGMPVDGSAGSGAHALRSDAADAADMPEGGERVDGAYEQDREKEGVR